MIMPGAIAMNVRGRAVRMEMHDARHVIRICQAGGYGMRTRHRERQRRRQNAEHIDEDD